jgi:DnaJ-class molecular chaperone
VWGTKKFLYINPMIKKGQVFLISEPIVIVLVEEVCQKCKGKPKKRKNCVVCKGIGFIIKKKT